MSNTITMPTEMPQENGTTTSTDMEIPPDANGKLVTKMTTGSDDVDMTDEDVINGPDLKDEFCDPENPIQVHFQDVSAAAYKIRGGVQRTPCQVCLVAIKLCGHSAIIQLTKF